MLVRQPSIEAMGFNRRKMEDQRREAAGKRGATNELGAIPKNNG